MWRSGLIGTVFGIVLVGGPVILLNCLSLGTQEASDILRSESSMSGEKYFIYLAQSIEKYRFLGAILLLLGGLGLILTMSNRS